MKYFTILIFFNLFTLFANAQLANFNWEMDTISPNNTLKGMTIHPGDGSSVIVGYDNTFLKSVDNGSTWQNSTMLKPEYNFIGMARGEDVLFISSRWSKVINHPSGGFPDVYTSGVMLKSTDMGATWEALDINAAEFNGDASINPNGKGSYAKDIFAIGALNKDTIISYCGWFDQTSGSKVSRGAVFRTYDGGDTWKKITPDLGSNTINCVEVIDSFAVFGGKNTLYHLNLITDSVSNIYPNIAVLTDDNVYINNIAFNTPYSFYVTTTTDGIFKTEDAGQTFTKLPEIDGANDLFIINDSTLLTLGSSTKSKVSTDNGATWTDCYPGATCYKIGGIMRDTIYGLAKEEAYKCAVSDLIAKTPSWKTVHLFDDNKLLQKMAIFDDDNAVIAGYGENCKYTIDGGLTWNEAQLPDDYLEDIEFDFNNISAAGDNAFVTVRRFEIADFSDIDSVNDFYMEGLLIKTEDNWETSTIIDASIIGENEGDDPTLNPQTEDCWGFNPNLVECVDANTTYLFANWYEDKTTGNRETRSRIFKTMDGGITWNGITTDFGAAYITGIEFTNDTGYIGGNKILQKTTDGGTTFIDLYPTLVETNEGDDNIFIQSIRMENGDEIYIPTTSDGVFFSTDGGNTFSKFNEIAGTSDIIKLDINSFLCMGTTSKSKFTNDAGATWQNASAGTTAYKIGGILNNSVVVLGRGIVMKVALADLDLKTPVPVVETKAALEAIYKPASIDLISSDGEIERCAIYSISGKLVSLTEPSSTTYQLHNNEFKSGIYIVHSLVRGKPYVNKIIFR
ncbi:MAG TPA: hypothetical protein VEP89_16360 [Draconibacterium sp.]|nr:hypothetical protein [Draconibacterium sp.]